MLVVLFSIMISVLILRFFFIIFVIMVLFLEDDVGWFLLKFAQFFSNKLKEQR